MLNMSENAQCLQTVVCTILCTLSSVGRVDAFIRAAISVEVARENPAHKAPVAEEFQCGLFRQFVAAVLVTSAPVTSLASIAIRLDNGPRSHCMQKTQISSCA